MEPEPLVTRDELTGTLFVIADISVNVRRITEILEEFGGEEAIPEDDS